ncbi:MAG: hypothetical protein PHF37_08970 [Phycisphaerae bacterium]|nr:hypothetical protein [Phycisphaerae bacterium]
MDIHHFLAHPKVLKLQSTCFKIFAVLIVLIGVLYMGVRSLRGVVLSQIEKFTGAEVTASSVKLGLFGDAKIDDLVVQSKGSNKPDDIILTAQNVYAEFSKLSLLILRPRLNNVRISDFTFNAVYDMDSGVWNLSSISLPKAHDLRGIPSIQLERGILQYIKISEGLSRVAAASPLEFVFGADKKKGGYAFEISTAKWLGQKSKLTGLWRPGRVIVEGSISSKTQEELEGIGHISNLNVILDYYQDNSFSLSLLTDGLEFEHGILTGKQSLYDYSFLSKLNAFAYLNQVLYQYEPSGRMDIGVRVKGDFNNLRDSHIDGVAVCKDAEINNAKFPYRITNLNGRINFDENSFTLENMQGRHGDSVFAFSGFSKGFGGNQEYELRAQSDNLVFDDDVKGALKPKIRSVWGMFSPAGVGRVDYIIMRRNNGERDFSVVIEPLRAWGAYSGFPYPLRNVYGRIEFSRDRVQISDITATTSSSRISINGNVSGISTKPIYDVRIKAENIGIDRDLKDVLAAKQNYFFEKFDMSGFVDADIKVFTPDSGLAADYVVEVSVKDASLSYLASGLKIDDINAQLNIERDFFDVCDFSGLCNGGKVEANGHFAVSSDKSDINEFDYNVSVKGEKIEIDKSLINSLPLFAAGMVSALNPGGVIDIKAELNKLHSDSSSFIEIACLEDRIKSDKFPYALYDLCGVISIEAANENYEIELRDLQASCGSLAIDDKEGLVKIGGSIQGESGGGITDCRIFLSADNVIIDENLIAALPVPFNKFYESLGARGSLDLNINEIALIDANTSGRGMAFDAELKFTDAALDSVGIADANVQVLANGRYLFDGGIKDCAIVVKAEKFRIYGKIIEDFNADFRHLGSNWVGQSLIAQAYGGKVTGHIKFSPIGDDWGYSLDSSFEDIDLGRFLVDPNGDINRHATGIMDGTFSLGGRFSEKSRLGRCRLDIENLQAGERSPMAKLVQAMQLSKSEDYVFERMLVDGYINTNKVYLEQFDLSGESIAFYGSGVLDIATKNIDLGLTARGKRLAGSNPSLFQSLTEGLGRAVVRLDVTGDMFDPEITTKTMPVLTEGIKMLGTKEGEKGD